MDILSLIRWVLAIISLSSSVTASSWTIWKQDGQKWTQISTAGELPQLIVPGSLSKPFAAYYLLTGLPDFDPELRFYCRGWNSQIPGVAHGCWHRPGHRSVGLESALLHSCNFYFYRLYDRIDHLRYFEYMNRNFGFPIPDSRTTPGPDTILFADEQQQISTPALIRAYFSLHSMPAADPIRNALSQPGGTLQPLHKAVRSIPDWKILWGKTGSMSSVRSGNTGMVAVFMENSGQAYFILAIDKGKMGKDIAGQLIPRILRTIPRHKKP